MIKKFILLIALVCTAALPSLAENSDPINSQIVPNGASDDAHIQAQIAEAKRAVAAQGPGFGLVGKLEKGRSTSFSINGEDFVVSDKTEISGDLRLGKMAEVTGLIKDGNKKIAQSVTIAADQVQSATEQDPSLFKLR